MSPVVLDRRAGEAEDGPVIVEDGPGGGGAVGAARVKARQVDLCVVLLDRLRDGGEGPHGRVVEVGLDSHDMFRRVGDESHGADHNETDSAARLRCGA